VLDAYDPTAVATVFALAAALLLAAIVTAIIALLKSGSNRIAGVIALVLVVLPVLNAVVGGFLILQGLGY
jgi:hypothetical protein